MRDRTRIRAGRSLGAAAVALALGGMGALALLGRWDFLFELFVIHNGVLAVGFGALAWTTIPSQPRNAAVWTLAWASFFGALFAASVAAAIILARGSIGELSVAGVEQMSFADFPLPAAIAAHLSSWAYIPAFLLVVTLGLLLFPDGRPPSTRWRWVRWYSVAAITAAAVGLAVRFHPTSTIVSDNYEGTSGRAVELLILLAMLGAPLSVAALVVRYRRSSGVTRHQIRWIALGGAFLVTVMVVSAVIEGVVAEPSIVTSIAMMGGETLLIASFWVAITKYRLYDVDVVISKTVTYASLAVVLAVLYGSAVVAFIFLAGDSEQTGGDLGVALPIGATLLVAVAFEPLRIRLRRWADRLVYGKRAAPHEVLSRLTEQLANTSTGADLTGLARLLREGTGADSAVVWLRVGDRLRPEAWSPPESKPAVADVAHPRELPENELEFHVGVRHGAELLGALGTRKPRAHPVTPADERLLRDVAAGAGLLLRNRRLNAELAERALQLQQSRRRLIAAHDAARHRLERNLHDGAQQQVVALKVKLGLAKAVAEQEGAADIAARVEDLATQTQEAVDAMRAVARGIYPPLLEAEGLAKALGALGRTTSLEVDVETGGLPRFGREMEETAYFCVVAAITRAEMAGARSASIELAGDASSLSVEITLDSLDDLDDLTAISDRVEAFGGTLTTAASTGETTLSFVLPAPAELVESA